MCWSKGWNVIIPLSFKLLFIPWLLEALYLWIFLGVGLNRFIKHSGFCACPVRENQLHLSNSIQAVSLFISPSCPLHQPLWDLSLSLSCLALSSRCSWVWILAPKESLPFSLSLCVLVFALLSVWLVCFRPFCVVFKFQWLTGHWVATPNSFCIHCSSSLFFPSYQKSSFAHGVTCRETVWWVQMMEFRHSYKTVDFWDMLSAHSHKMHVQESKNGDLSRPLKARVGAAGSFWSQGSTHKVLLSLQ